jgi:hypothetical protein
VLSTTPDRYSNRHSRFAQTFCTIGFHSSPTAVILHTHNNSILLKTFAPQEEKHPVAPNVAGSIPVSHPKNSQ